MSKHIKLYLDEDAQDAQRTDLIQALRARQIDVVTVSDVNLLGEGDDVQLRYATEQDRVIFSFNRGDFFRLHTKLLSNNQHHAGIIVSNQVGTGIVMRRLLRLINEKTATDMLDWLEFLGSWQ